MCDSLTKKNEWTKLIKMEYTEERGVGDKKEQTNGIVGELIAALLEDEAIREGNVGTGGIVALT